MAVGIAWGTGLLQGGENALRYAAPHQHAQTAKQTALSECAGRKGNALVECVEEQIQTAEETARDEQDLTAQQQAAWGSMFSATWGGIALCVTVVGTILLYQQIVLTRKAVQETTNATKAMEKQNDIAERAQRPWLSVKLIKLGPIDREPSGKFSLTYQLSIENTGIFPAISIIDHAAIVSEHFGTKDREYFIKHAMAIHAAYGLALAPGETFKTGITKLYIDTGMILASGLCADGSMPMLMIGVVYQTQTSTIPLCTALNIHPGSVFSAVGPRLRPVAKMILRKIMT
ncbi:MULTISPECIES: hypothetical protein [unclassified Sphingomonas]|uniref:hypothetical protein n=1 Tax=unclassified Sphingomonas TaxID=196159 RepID=UPI0026D1FD8B